MVCIWMINLKTLPVVILSKSIVDRRYLYSWVSIVFLFCMQYRLHRLLSDDGADDKKSSFHRLIKASKNGTAADLEQGHQVC